MYSEAKLKDSNLNPSCKVEEETLRRILHNM